MLLPVDVIYVTADDNLKEVTKIGPIDWFDSKERESWPHKQTLNLRSGIEVRLKLNKPPDTKYVVIFAPFFKGEDQEAQQIILPPDPEESKKEKEEVVWVGANSLYH
jgi:CDP-glycerol glycerophosphotransferase (TagB/SpsB family)